MDTQEPKASDRTQYPLVPATAFPTDTPEVLKFLFMLYIIMLCNYECLLKISISILFRV